MTRFEDQIADTVLETFDALPAKRKPRQREDGSREWVPLSGIVLSKGSNELACVSLGTGMKCLPRSKIPQANGMVLHDCHAEILAIRSFNRFLIQECHDLVLAGEQSSRFVRRRRQSEISTTSFQPFAMNNDIRIHMFSSEAPCGDASMELTMSAQEDPTPWAVPPPATIPTDASLDQTLSSSAQALPGRAYFSQLGVVRRKPSRPDAPPTLSKSCSDKMAHMQSTSLLSSVASLLIHPSSAYLSTLVLPESQYSATACTRAFSPSGRLKALAGRQWEGGYAFQPFDVRTATRDFIWSRRNPASVTASSIAPVTPAIGDGRSSSSSSIESTGPKYIASNLSAVHTSTPRDQPPSKQLQETLINGVLQGRKIFDPRGASILCRKRMWRAVVDVLALATAAAAGAGTTGAISSSHPSGPSSNFDQAQYETYETLKSRNPLLESRRKVKADVRSASGLPEWVRNDGDEDFRLD
ncbi:hypothetical protein L228DRAFT_283349 [Xylona heveae TC161]|uniref:A to I editase domain-containing protein n=1 Tax=Xylona heveae (strain CBS 132557 / TC161) TaxID=1328760 RepID=A0A165GH17_XYLHT|nr:hypothetical protein L228DRAFT_283349 [Xylona heveae TC161]KZF22175.1 hypothetical protein L228DRAFT_283349 [Xylona heveae TC161]